MKITVVTPAPPKSLKGNRATAVRWARFLEESGHEVSVEEAWGGEYTDLLIALHARRSFSSISAFAQSHRDKPLVVVLTGTDLYWDIRTDDNAQESLHLATCLVVLQDAGLDELDLRHRRKSRVIYQSADGMSPAPPHEHFFDICILGNLRNEKDPFRAALATSLLPPESRIRVLHAGNAHDSQFEEAAHAHMQESRRYHWLGEVPRQEARGLLCRSRLLVQSSNIEGGANSICEALAAGTPVIASEVPGNVGMLGEDYPGFYPVGDEESLAELLARAERDEDFYRSLKLACEARRHLVSPDRERAALRRLVTEITPEGKDRAADL
ncbi:GPMC system family 4 glycosyltransferase [soil metagenome]